MALRVLQLLVRSADDVPDGDAAFGPGPLHLVEVHAELLGLLLRGLRGVRLLLTTGGLLRRLLALLRGLLPLLSRLTGRLLGLTGRLARGVLRLLGGPAGRLLGLPGHLPGLVGRLTGRFLRLAGRLTGGVLRALRDLAYLIGDPTEGASTLLSSSCWPPPVRPPTVSCTWPAAWPGGVLHLLCWPATGGVLGLARHLLGLIRGLARGLLRLLRRPLRKFRHLLLRGLGRLVHLILDALVLGRLVYGPFELHVVVGHLLNLGLGIALGELLGVLLELLPVVLDLALQAADGLRVEVPQRSAETAAGFAAEGSSLGSCCALSLFAVSFAAGTTGADPTDNFAIY